MLSEADTVFAMKLFLVAVALVVGLGLVLIGVMLKAQASHAKRLKRVSRSKLVGQYDPDEVRLKLQRSERDAGLLTRMADVAARLLPILDAARLRAKFSRAGLEITLGAFLVYTLLLAVPVAGLFWFVMGLAPPLALILGLVAAMYASDAVVRMMGERRAERFMEQLPDALDTLIRGIRSGLPVSDGIATIGKEFGDPAGRHFADVSERVKLGETLDGSLWGVAKVIQRPEMDFLAISISIQMETGGSLAEALSGLADLLRKRQQMRLKIRAISSEAKASGLIIGALPFVMLGLLSLMAPDYIKPLFTDPRGQALLGLGFGSILIGAFVMWRMTKFEL
jgi:tight adherence protein B